MERTLYRKFGRWALRLAVVAAVALCFQPDPGAAQSNALKRSGTVQINQAQVAFIFSTNVGGGTLSYEGKSYPFTIGGLGVGGIGISSIDAKGEVYNMTKLSDFSGTYGQARKGLAIGEDLWSSGFWLENTSGVYIRLEAERKGVALSIGLDAVYIKFD